MIKRLGHLSTRINDRLVDRWPLAVMFGLPVAIPISTVLLMGGTVAAAATPIERPQEAALTLVSDARRDGYAAALATIHAECRDLQPPSGTCFTDEAPTSTAAVLGLTSAIIESGLDDCRPRPLPAENVSRYDYFVCRGDPLPSNSMLFVFLTLAGAGLFMVLGLLARVTQARALIPRFNPNLWITPWAAAVPALATAPLLTAAVVSFSRLGPGGAPTIAVVVETLVWLSCLSLLVATGVVADLRTFPPQRIYPRGLVVLLVLISVALTSGMLGFNAVLGEGNSVATMVLAASLALSGVAMCVWARRRPEAPFVSRSTGDFLLRWLKLAWLVLLGAVVLALDGVVEASWAGVAPVQVAALFLAVSLMASASVERSLEQRQASVMRNGTPERS